MGGRSRARWQTYFAGRCVYCGRRVYRRRLVRGAARRTASIEHVDCHAHGGVDELSNYALACVSCNASRGDRPLYSWLVGRILQLGAARDSSGRRSLEGARELADLRIAEMRACIIAAVEGEGLLTA